MMKKLIMGVLMLLGLTTNAMAEDLDSLYAQSLLKVGTQAPNFELPTPEGKKVQLSDFKGKYVLIDFWASWCAPCRMLSPVIEQLHNEFEGKAVVAKVDVDNNQQVSLEYGIRSIPTLLIFKNGEVVDKIVGLSPKEVIAEKLSAHL